VPSNTRQLNPVIAAAVCVLSAAGHADEKDPIVEAEKKGLVVGNIEYDIYNVFDLENEEENNALFRAMNRLRFKTRESVIRKQLLFREDDTIVAQKLNETARILRTRSYLFDAEVKLENIDDDSADVRVVTRDVWTLVPDISLTRSGGQNESQIGLEEMNLLGRGHELKFNRTSDVDRDSTRLELSDPHLGRSWVQGTLRIADNSDGRSNLLSVNRPFVELDARWSAAFSAFDDTRRIPLYRLGEEAAEFERQTRRYAASLGWSRGLVDNWAKRYTAGVVYDDNRFAEVPEPLPTLETVIPRNRELAYPFVGFEWIENRFEEAQNRNAMGRTEDFFLGTRVTGQLGFVSESFGADRNAVLVNGTYSTGFGSIDKTALFARASIDARIEDGRAVNALGTFSASYYRNQSEKRLFFASVSGTVGHALDIDNPVQLGGDNGLRGYPLRYQNGDSKVLLTLEQRYYSDWYPWRLFRLGAAVFFDVGRSFGDSPIGEPNAGWLRDVGFGLRFAPTRGGIKKIIHLDFAFPLDGDESIDSLQILLEAKRSF